MFQYAAGRRLAGKVGSELKLDITWFDSNSERQYSLRHLSIHENFALEKEILGLKYLSPSLYDRVLKTLGLRSSLLPPAPGYIKERLNRFDPEILTLSDDVYLEGYWQSEKYFFDIRDVIRKEFYPRAPLSAEGMKIADSVSSCESVSIHIRRGDYVSNALVNSHHGVCSLKYYHQGIQYIASHMPELNFFVFSDDPLWCRQNLHIPFHTSFIDRNDPERDYEDLHLMSLCKHHIIANSSFSWWGAWLATSPYKIVVGPKKWFALKERSTQDLIPRDWITL